MGKVGQSQLSFGSQAMSQPATSSALWVTPKPQSTQVPPSTSYAPSLSCSPSLLGCSRCWWGWSVHPTFQFLADQELEALGFYVQQKKSCSSGAENLEKHLTARMRRSLPGSKTGNTRGRKTHWNFKVGCAKSSSSSEEVPGPRCKGFQSRWIYLFSSRTAQLQHN